MQEQNGKTANDLRAPVAAFCLALETERRTPEGRIRSEREFREHFFPYSEAKAEDRLLRLLPNTVRGPIIAAWGIRGQKSALRDDDARVQTVVHDAFVAGDLDDPTFEQGLEPGVVVGWAELADWWKFWRGGKQTKRSIRGALETAYDLGLFDAAYFLDTIESVGGKLRGTDVLAEGLGKTDLAGWIQRIHSSGDGSPRGLLAALGWETIVAKTDDRALLAVIDAMAIVKGLVRPPEPKKEPQAADGGATAEPAAAAGPGAAAAGDGPTMVSVPNEPPSSTTFDLTRESSPSFREGDDLNGASGPASETTMSADSDWLENPVELPGADSVTDVDAALDTKAIAGAVEAAARGSDAAKGSAPEEPATPPSPKVETKRSQASAPSAPAARPSVPRRSGPPPLPPVHAPTRPAKG